MPTSLTAVPAYDHTCCRCGERLRTLKASPRQCPKCGTRRWETGSTPPKKITSQPQGE